MDESTKDYCNWKQLCKEEHTWLDSNCPPLYYHTGLLESTSGWTRTENLCITSRTCYRTHLAGPKLPSPVLPVRRAKKHTWLDSNRQPLYYQTSSLTIALWRHHIFLLLLLLLLLFFFFSCFLKRLLFT